MPRPWALLVGVGGISPSDWILPSQPQDQITITGYEKNTEAARDAILKIVGELEQMVSEDVPLDHRVHARIIGARGKAIRKIMDEFKVPARPRQEGARWAGWAGFLRPCVHARCPDCQGSGGRVSEAQVVGLTGVTAVGAGCCWQRPCQSPVGSAPRPSADARTEGGAPGAPVSGVLMTREPLRFISPEEGSRNSLFRPLSCVCPFQVDIRFPQSGAPDPNCVTVTGLPDNVEEAIDHILNLEEEYVSRGAPKAALGVRGGVPRPDPPVPAAGRRCGQ